MLHTKVRSLCVFVFWVNHAEQFNTRLLNALIIGQVQKAITPSAAEPQDIPG